MNEFPTTLPIFLNVAGVADLLKVKPRTIYSWVANREKSGIPVEHVGGALRFRLDRLLEWTSRAPDAGNR